MGKIVPCLRTKQLEFDGLTFRIAELTSHQLKSLEPSDPFWLPITWSLNNAAEPEELKLLGPWIGEPPKDPGPYRQLQKLLDAQTLQWLEKQMADLVRAQILRGYIDA